MTHIINEIGNRYGMLTVIEYVGSHKAHAMWKCICDCGTARVTSGGHLRAENTTNCGCARRLEWGESAFNSILHKWKKAAYTHGLSWNLSDKDVKELPQQNCFYCNTEPAQIHKPGNCWGPFIYNGLDRVDNNIGYESYNIVPSCFICNRAKNVMSAKDFIDMAHRITQNHA